LIDLRPAAVLAIMTYQNYEMLSAGRPF